VLLKKYRESPKSKNEMSKQKRTNAEHKKKKEKDTKAFNMLG
jgi:hypothetical protein